MSSIFCGARIGCPARPHWLHSPVPQVKYQVCRVFVIQLEQTAQDRQLALRAGVRPHMNTVADLLRLCERVRIRAEEARCSLPRTWQAFVMSGFILRIQNLDDLLEHLCPACHWLLGVLECEPGDQTSGQFALVLKRIGIELLLCRLEGRWSVKPKS